VSTTTCFTFAPKGSLLTTCPFPFLFPVLTLCWRGPMSADEGVLAAWCSVLHCVAVCVAVWVAVVLQCVAVCWGALQCITVYYSVLQCVAVCCSVLQCVAVCCTMSQCVSVSQCLTVCSSVLCESSDAMTSLHIAQHRRMKQSSSDCPKVQRPGRSCTCWCQASTTFSPCACLLARSLA